MPETMVLSHCGIDHPGTLDITDIGAGSGLEVRVHTQEKVPAEIYQRIESVCRARLDAAHGTTQVFLFVPGYQMRHFGRADQGSQQG